MMDGYSFSRIMLTLKRFNTSGSVNEMLALTQNICYVDVDDETHMSRNSCIAKNVWTFHTTFYLFYGEKECTATLLVLS